MQIHSVRSIRICIIGIVSGGVAVLVLCAAISWRKQAVQPRGGTPQPVAGDVAEDNSEQLVLECSASPAPPQPGLYAAAWDDDAAGTTQDRPSDRNSTFLVHAADETLLNSDSRVAFTAAEQSSAQHAAASHDRASTEPVPPALFPTVADHPPLETMPSPTLPTPVPAQRLTDDDTGICQTCELWRREDNTRLATVVIGSTVTTSPIEDRQLRLAAATHATIESMPCDRPADIRSWAAKSKAKPDFTAEVYVDERSQRLNVDASNAGIEDVLSRLSATTGQDIRMGPGVEGTITASFSDGTLDGLLRRLLEPFGFVVTRHDFGFAVTSATAPPHSEVRTLPISCESEMAAVSRLPQAEPATALPATAALEQDVVARDDRPSPGEQRATSLDQPTVPSEDVSGLLREVSVDEFESRQAYVAYQLLATGHVSTAIDILSDAVTKSPSSPELYRLLGQAYFHRRDFSTAHLALKTAVSIDKYDPVANQLLGLTLMQMGQPQRGQHYLLQAQAFEARQDLPRNDRYAESSTE